MQIQDTNKSEGVFEIRNYRLPYSWRKVVQFISWFQSFTKMFKIDYAFLLTQRHGKLLWTTGEMHNLGMTNRLPVIAGLYGGVDSQSAFTYLALGTSSTAVSAGQTGLQAEITDSGLQRASATVSRVTTTSTNDTTQLTKVFTATGTKIIEEIGYFNASSGVTMGGRALTTTKTVGNGDTVTPIYKIKHS